MPGFEEIVARSSPWTAGERRHRAGQGSSWRRSQNPKTNVTIYSNESPPNKDVAVAMQSMWKQIGIDSTIKILEWQQFLEFMGPPPPTAVDVFRLGWVGDFVDDDQLPRAVDVRLGEQQHGLLRQGVRRARRRGAKDAGQRRALRDLRPARGEAHRAGRRRCRSSRSGTSRTRTSSGSRQGNLQHQPPRPGRPDEGGDQGELAPALLGSSGGALRRPARSRRRYRRGEKG